MEFSTDKFMSILKSKLDTIEKEITGDMIADAVIVAERLIDNSVLINCDENLVLDMAEIGQLANMSINTRHDCKRLFDEFDQRFRFDHGEGKHSANALDVMRVITEIGNDIEQIAPHVSFLFEDDDEFFPNIFNESFVNTSEITAE